eukprot:TRINITY_DN2129_c0_g1_i4.p1 TRINITY_DN2129_c0_g1~~TRINITY_DN2129_c0_g1_i4.p1  ORF type:complete len:492 (-),score=117.75 TRINITY_DN2129_c0_g1_i4:236-1675(-)
MNPATPETPATPASQETPAGTGEGGSKRGPRQLSRQTTFASRERTTLGDSWKLSLVLWVVPLVVVAAWLALPLSTSPLNGRFVDGQGATQYGSYFGWFVWSYHGIYILLAASTGYVAFDVYFPVTPVPVLIAMAFVSYVIDGLYLSLLWDGKLSVTSFRIAVASSMFPAMLPVFLFVLYITRRAKKILKNATSATMLLSAATVAVPTLETPAPPKRQSTLSKLAHSSTKFLETTVHEDSLGHIKPSRTFFMQFFFLAAALVVVLLNYYFCQLFTFAYFEYARTEGIKVAFAAFFPYLLVPFSVTFKYLLKKADEGVNMPEGFPGLAPLADWLADLFYYMFYRNLFTSVSQITTLIGFVVFQAAQEALFYPIRMTRMAYRFEKWFKHLFISGAKMDFSEAELFAHRQDLCTSYYFLTMCQRMSITNFAVSLVIIYNSYNKEMYLFSNLSENEYRRLLTFCLIQFVIEWVGSTVVWLVIRV